MVRAEACLLLFHTPQQERGQPEPVTASRTVVDSHWMLWAATNGGSVLYSRQAKLRGGGGG
jgi:hypothetical protein